MANIVRLDLLRLRCYEILLVCRVAVNRQTTGLGVTLLNTIRSESDMLFKSIFKLYGLWSRLVVMEMNCFEKIIIFPDLYIWNLRGNSYSLKALGFYTLL